MTKSLQDRAEVQNSEIIARDIAAEKQQIEFFQSERIE